MKTSDFYAIPHLVIPQRQILNVPLWYLDTNNPDGIKKIFRSMKSLTRYGFDNTHLKWSNIFGHHFAVSVYYSKAEYWDVQVWDHTGNKTLTSFRQKVENKEIDILSSENYDKMCRITENYVRGTIHCSSCLKEIKTSEVAGNYFAGSYCLECWEGKWKEIEANENYN